MPRSEIQFRHQTFPIIRSKYMEKMTTQKYLRLRWEWYSINAVNAGLGAVYLLKTAISLRKF